MFRRGKCVYCDLMDHDIEELRQPGTHRLFIPWDGRKRRALVHVPPGYQAGRPTPVVLMLHGAGATARWTIQQTEWTDKADAEGFLAVFPEGVPADPSKPQAFSSNPLLWNDGSARRPLGTHEIDDVGFLRALLDDLESHLTLDPRRVFATGFSVGGGMAFRLGAELADRVAAIAPVAANCWVEKPKPVRPVSALYLLGTDDPLVPLRGRHVRSPLGYVIRKPPVMESIQRWAQALDAPTTPQVLQDCDGVRVERYGPGKDGAELIVCLILGLGHHWPGGKGLLTQYDVGPPSDKVRATDALWEFFRTHPMT